MRLALDAGHRQSRNRRGLASRRVSTLLGPEGAARSTWTTLISCEVRDLIRKMCRENPLLGAPRIHGELLKLGINIAESSVSKYMVRGNKPPSQTWRTFLENHAHQMVSIDFFTVPTIRFQVLYVLLVLAHDRRHILHFNVAARPTAQCSLGKDAPEPRAIQPAEMGSVVAVPQVGGLQHCYERRAA